jgi:hypothetical protein
LQTRAGGIIAIGVEDPTVGGNLQIAQAPTDISDKRQLSYTSSINALVYPQPPFEIHPYRDDESGRTLLVARVGSSTVGPHEYVGGDESINLPIRRGTGVKSLSLTEIEALQRRRNSSGPESPLRNRSFQKVYLQQSGTGGDFYFGIHVAPITYGPRRIMDPDDNNVCLSIEERTRGQNNIVHVAMTRHESTTDGFWMHTGDAPGQNAQPNLPTGQVEIDSDSQVLIRFAQRETDVLDQYINSFLTAYAIAQEVFYHFRIAPAARFHILAHLNAQAKVERAPQFHEDRVNVELARESFADAFTDTVMVMLRGADQARRRGEIRSLLAQHEDKLSFLKQQLERWLEPADAGAR